MKIFNFHLMPYRHVDLDAVDRNGNNLTDQATVREAR